MTTSTTRYGMAKIVPLSDNVDVVVDFNNNWDLIDTRLGTQVCTSSTRPSSPVQGQICFETDTGYVRKWTGAAWQTVGNATATSGARPANPIQGDLLFESDTGFVRKYNGTTWTTVGNASATSGSLPANPVSADIAYISNTKALSYYDGTNWHYASPIACTSSTRPTGSALQAGTVIYETDTIRVLVYNGTSWEQKAFGSFVCTSSTHPASPYAGLEIYETDTGMSAVYSGSIYQYGMQQIASTQVLVGTTASVTFSGIPPVSRLLLTWRARESASGATDLLMQIDANTGNNYLWSKIESNAGTAGGSHAGAATSSIKIGVIDATTTSYFGSGHQMLDGWSNATGFMTSTGPYSNFSSPTTDWSGNSSGQYSGVGPHTSVKIFPSANSFAAGTQLSLYALM